MCIKRTSPSGGGLHPITAYPIIANVEGIAPGVYHYNAGDHSLALVSSLTTDEAHELATAFMSGQSYFGSAHVSFVLAARFYRNHWKYRRHASRVRGDPHGRRTSQPDALPRRRRARAWRLM